MFAVDIVQHLDVQSIALWLKRSLASDPSRLTALTLRAPVVLLLSVWIIASPAVGRAHLDCVQFARFRSYAEVLRG